MTRQKRTARPRVLTKCVADTYAGDGERIIEFSSDHGGGLIAFRLHPSGRLHVDVYRTDKTVRVRHSKG